MDRETFYKWLIFSALIFTLSVFAAGPRDASEWFRMAQDARQNQELAEAHSALDNAEQQGFQPVRVAFERARLFTLEDEPAKAVATLQALADGGFTAVGFITSDPILSTLGGHTGFDRLVAELTRVAYPCENDAAFHAFDFWVGDWVVHGPDGALAGSNTIERSQRGCVLLENWTSASGGTGMSINYLDMASGEWVQVWNAEGGSQIHIRGGMTDQGMLLEGTLHTIATNTTVPFRGLWTPLEDGRVRQLFEQSTDGGKTWTTWFEGFYARKQ